MELGEGGGRSVLTYNCLDHGRSLYPQHLHCLVHVHYGFITHPLQDDTQGHEHTSTTDSSTDNNTRERQGMKYHGEVSMS